MRLNWFGSTVVVMSMIVGCGGDDKGAGGQAQGAGGQMQGGEGGAGGSAGSGAGGSTGSETGGGGQGPTDCPEAQVSCNGACLPVGVPAGGCTVLAHAGKHVSIDHGIAVDASHVYWVEQLTHTAVARVAKAGGEREEIYGSRNVPLSVAVDEKNVYWAENSVTHWLRAMPKSGGAVIDLVTFVDDFGSIEDVVTDGERVFFTQQVRSGPLEVRSIGLDAGDEAVHGPAGDIFSTTLALDSGFVYWKSVESFEKDDILRSPRTGGEPQVVVTVGGGTLLGFAISGEFIYYMSPGAIWRMPVSGGDPTEVLSSPDVEGTFFVAHAQALYWASSGALWRVGVDGKNPTRLVKTDDSISHIAADTSGVYLAINKRPGSSGDGFIVRAED
ncbi:hypothetical protein WME97_33335 [Sorangium sp. So ce367]|uniref:hypothetical protein n=1 Tax=Sorangium sp. So ce367 TaxID=3133305 RepID=UPI003F621189